MNQLFSSFSKVQDIRSLAQITGESDLSEMDQTYMAYGRFFEEHFINQKSREARTIEESLDIGWEALSILPAEVLDRLNQRLIETYHRR